MHIYTGQQLNHIAFPLGGIGAGMMCMEGSGRLSHVSLHHHPQVYHEPTMFAAIHVNGTDTSRVLEGPVPTWKAFFPWGGHVGSSGRGGQGKDYGLPRFAEATFTSAFPFASVSLHDPQLPIHAEISGWSPFTPPNADDSSLPMLALEYKLVNISEQPLDLVFSYHARDFMRRGEESGSYVRAMDRGFAFCQPSIEGDPSAEGYCAICLDEAETHVDVAWFRGGWFDDLTMVWNKIAAGRSDATSELVEGKPSPGGSVYAPFHLDVGASRTLRLRVGWYVPHSNQATGPEFEGCDSGCGCGPTERMPKTHRPWYADRFGGIDEVMHVWAARYEELRAVTASFRDCLEDTTLPACVLDAVSSNLAILRSPTCHRQHDGRFWAWEGCNDDSGCCPGSCTHVWNYAQSLAHLFPSLERSLRESEYVESQDERGHQNFRTALPIRTTDHSFHAAADGQLGGLIKLYRDWRISGDRRWLERLWPAAERSLSYCIETWDPDHLGTLVEPHHNTYDIEFWGADGMCTSIYLAALVAAIEIGEELGADVNSYVNLLESGRARLESDLWNGEYFIQLCRWDGMRAGHPAQQKTLDSYAYSTEALAILANEGPKYQYGQGCLSDGIIGDWLARCAGLKSDIDSKKIRAHVNAVYRHNFRANLSTHANPQRPTYAMGSESGLVLCSWPHGGKPSLPFVYSEEVWTGIEYQVASHLIMMGEVEKGIEIVAAVRSRYDGKARSPFDEYECGHWYARAMASFSLLQAFTGARYDAVTRTLHISPSVDGDFRALLCTNTGFGTVGISDGRPFFDVVYGYVDIDQILLDS